MDNSHKPAYGDSFWYATKVWLTGVLVPAVFWGLAGGLGILGLSIVFSGGFSIPSWLIFWGCVWYVNDQMWSNWTKKMVLQITSVPLTGLAYALMGWGWAGVSPLEIFTLDAIGIQLYYAVVICLAVQGFDLPDHNPEISEEPTGTNAITPTDHLHDTND